MHTLSNGLVTLCVEDHGAELSSIRYQGREYLWGAYPEYWKRHSPVLFPIVGTVWQGEYRTQGQTYHLGQHGLARDLDFSFVKETSGMRDGQPYPTVEYVLRSSEETLLRYPYPFELHITYGLSGKRIDVIWTVVNTGKTVMPFQIGAHPAFYWPLLSDETIAAGLPAMERVLADSENRGFFFFPERPAQLVRTLLGEGGCADVECKEPVLLDDGYLPLTTHTFDRDALVLEDHQVQAVTLCDQARRPYLTLRWEAPLVGLWSSPGKNAPFVCIEPWYGRTDRTRYFGLFDDKDWMQHLAPGDTFSARYSIEPE